MSAPSPFVGRFDIISILHHYAIQARMLSMTNIQCWCPFHEDTKPSLSIDLKTGLWKCFGCNLEGNIIDFVARIEDLDNDLKTLVRIFTIQTEERVTRPDFNIFDLEKEPDTDIERFDLPDWDDLHEKFKHGKRKNPRFAVFKRGLTPLSLKTFQVRWDPRSEHYIFPVYWRHKIIGFQRRVTHDEDPKYRNSVGLPRKSILWWSQQFPDAVIEPDRVPLVCEGIFDAMTAYEYGWTNVIHTFGATVSPQQIAILISIGNLSGGLFIGFDKDQAGKEGKLRLLNVGLPIPTKQWRTGTDINSISHKEFWESINDIWGEHTWPRRKVSWKWLTRSERKERRERR